MNPTHIAEFIHSFPSGSVSEIAQARLIRLLAAQEDNLRVQEANENAARLELARKERDEAFARERAAVLASAELERKAAERSLAEQRAAAAAQAALEESQRLAAEKLAAERAAAGAERVVAERMALDRAAAEQAAEKRVAAEKIAVERVAAERARLVAVENERLQQIVQQRLAAEGIRIAKAEQVAQLEREQERERQERLREVASIALRVTQTVNYKGFDEHRRQYKVGQQFQFRIVDRYSGQARPLALKVSSVDIDADRVVYNDGEYVSDLMGNITRNTRGSFEMPRQFYPAELFVGKRWTTEFKQTRPGGVVYTFRYDLQVVAREKVSVPAGEFDTYRIEARGWNVELGAFLSRNIWVAPGVSADIAHETLVRLRNGTIDQNDRQELVALN